MSTEYRAVTVVGYIESFKTVLKPFLHVGDLRSLLQEWFSPKTGKPTGSVKVVDTPAGWDLVIGEDVFDDPEDPESEDDEDWETTNDELYEALSALLGCCVQVRGGEYSQWWVCITPDNIPPTSDMIELSVINNALQNADIALIKTRVEKHGIKLGRCGVWSVVEDY